MYKIKGTENISTMFSKWEKHIKMLTLEQAEECSQHNGLWKNYLNDNKLNNVTLCCFSTDHCEAIKWHSITSTLIMPSLWCRDGKRGWEVDGPQNPLIGVIIEMLQVAKRLSNLFLIYGICKMIHYLKLFHPWALSEHWSSLQFSITSFTRVRVHKTNTHPEWHRKVGEPGFWFPCCTKEIKELGTSLTANNGGKRKKVGHECDSYFFF